MADDGTSNQSDNRPFADILDARLARRTVLGGGLATAALTFLGASPALAEGATVAGARVAPALRFEAIPLSRKKNEVTVPAGFSATPFLPWGTPILPGAGAGTLPANGAEQTKRIGLGHDGMWFFPTVADRTRGILCLNQEYGTNQHVTNGTGIPGGTPEMTAISKALHGVSVVEIALVDGTWQVVMGGKNRRIHADTPMAFSGPAASSPLLVNQAGNEPKGTINNCANGKTPWGTYLTCEENFNGYFAATGRWTATPQLQRYGFSAAGARYGWHLHDPRFDLSNAAYANEANRFGWVVEIDPSDAGSTPVKRTALGRLKHENAELVEGRGKRVVVYMGDDERFEYVYKFVSADNWKSMRARGQSPLDHGTLYAATFEADGTGTWHPLTMENPQVAAKFASIDEVLVNARAAGDAVGATKMDRPEWAAADPRTGDVYITMTNNTSRSASDAANPRSPNPWGHIVRIQDADQHVGTTFRWDHFVMSGPAGVAGSTTDPNSEHGSPDGLAFAPDGTLVIQTDGMQPSTANDANEAGATPTPANDQMLLADPVTREIKRFLTGVRGCEVTGWTPLAPGTQMVNLQHPGDGDPKISNWPSTDPTAVPRDACVIITQVG